MHAADVNNRNVRLHADERKDKKIGKGVANQQIPSHMSTLDIRWLAGGVSCKAGTAGTAGVAVPSHLSWLGRHPTSVAPIQTDPGCLSTCIRPASPSGVCRLHTANGD